MLVNSQYAIKSQHNQIPSNTQFDKDGENGESKVLNNSISHKLNEALNSPISQLKKNGQFFNINNPKQNSEECNC